MSIHTQRLETISVVAEAQGFRSAGTVVVLNQNFRHENETKLFFDCLDVSILQPETYRGRKATILLPFAEGPYEKIRRPGFTVSVHLNKWALANNQPDLTVYCLDDLQIKEVSNK